MGCTEIYLSVIDDEHEPAWEIDETGSDTIDVVGPGLRLQISHASAAAVAKLLAERYEPELWICNRPPVADDAGADGCAR